ncbi:MAG: hypothetical protein WKF37_19735 [Bryobacteraceae bacterium]
MRILAALIAFAALLAAADVYSGKWESKLNGNGGEIRIQLKPEPSVSFTFNGTEVKTKVASVSQHGSDFAIAYDYDVEGYTLRSSLKGTVKDSVIEGTYSAAPADGGSAVDQGTFRVSLGK